MSDFIRISRGVEGGSIPNSTGIVSRRETPRERSETMLSAALGVDPKSSTGLCDQFGERDVGSLAKRLKGVRDPLQLR